MFRFIRNFGIGLLVSGSAYGSTVEDFSALHGCWRGNVDAGILEESWSAISAGMMFGRDQLMDTKGVSNLGWGTMTLSSNGSTVQYGYADTGAAQELFDLKEMTGANGDFVATFENGSTTSVNKIILTLSGGQSMRIQLFGSGHAAGLEVVLQRTSATAECK